MLCRLVLRLYMLVIPNQVRGKALGGGNVAGSNGKPCRTNGQRGHDCRCFGGPAKGAKGTLDKSVAGSIHHQYIALYTFSTLCFFRCCCRIQSFHAELHQYKHQIEVFSQLTQKLIKVYPTDDTSRIKRMTESVNLR